MTAVPLLMFAAGAKRLRLSTLGFLQYLSPTCQFLLAVFAYHEPFRREQLASFALIWAGLFAFTLETVVFLRSARRRRPAVAASAEDVDAPTSPVMVPD